ncbi:Hydroxy monocarboxylic acid anion dehydrogenase,HIBADH-type [Moorella glycerini]|uniref:6-phosphogluconate dehydrogenase, decarboxylating n=1 Tax=Neomoorella stamsii TaxID=1266720 RepID=A0A9X7J3F4_9FIRM|nr:MULTISPECIES: decarboxylating 6-phosphogluconate dehydrogenase [Moorella]PRR72987.1 6-phosphogluconate dehydrogenase, decarboxylating [Moorella stamsii]CEP67658.1 Hydroxy monocarboxylic acid anion dehydrogenase,HIBADH-type [Moorella glycerini]
MQVGLVGLGKMGLNLALNIMEHGHEVIGYARTKATVDKAAAQGIKSAYSLEELVGQLKTPRLVWLMIPAGLVIDEVIEQLLPLLTPGDIIVDGGNSHYRDTLRRYQYLKEKGIRFADSGTSGGMEGARYGACCMVGAEDEVFAYLEPLFKDITVPGGYLHTGPPGSGHYVKMIHNGIEYGMMQAIGEGMEVLAKGPFKLDLKAVARVWRHGSVIRGWLMDLMESALSKDATLESIKDIAYSSGEGLWTVEEALRLKVPAPVITAALLMRYRSEQEESFATKVVAALRHEFGGHDVARK